MQSAKYYRDNAAKARRLMAGVTPGKTSEMLEKLARDYEDIATDLERGAIEIVHPSLMPQLDHEER
jgi:hypothetical protein